MNNYLEELNEAQRDAVVNTEGPSLVIAGAGSGKTRVLTYRIAHLLKNGVPPSSILALTFTNKAAREMKERIAKIVGSQTARYLWMGTFHSIFARILRSEAEIIGYPSSFTIYDTQDTKSLLKTIIKSMKLDDKTYKPGLVYNRISAAKNNLITPTAYLQNTQIREADQASRMPRLAEVYKEYARRCKNASAMDFDDLLLQTNLLFKNHEEILAKYQQRFKYILVDEYQDTNFSQYLIVKKLALGHENICVVGDDAQSIYSFRGAKIENILNFRKDYPEFNTYKLEQNYRSTQTIVDAANSLIEKNKRQLPKRVFSENAEGEKIQVIGALTDNEEGYLVANEIIDTRMNHQHRFADFAILYRTNAQSRIFEEALRKRNIPYKIYGGLSFYQRKEIKDLLAYYRLAINVKDDEAFKRVINYPARGIGNTTMGRLETYAVQNNQSIWEIASNPDECQTAGLNAGTQRKVAEFIHMIEGFASQLTSMEAYELALQIASESGMLKEFYKDKTPENLSRYENVQELLNAIQDFSLNAKEEGRPNQLNNFMEEVALLTDQDTDKEEDFDKVTLMTVHSSKGLEFKNVFIVGLEENLFPSGFSGTLTGAELEEERRLFYVALTRAEENAWLSFAKQRYRWGNLEFCNPSRFIGEIDEQFLNLKSGGLQAHLPRRESVPPAKEEATTRRSPMGIRSQQGNEHLGKRLTRMNEANRQNAAAFAGSDPEEIQAGMFVEHQRFGRGKVIAIEGTMPDRKAKVFFPNAGEKHLLLKFAKLKIVE
ncbi:DNA helicase [Prolixibacter bellariivorans]|uniref:DNA 3'-5' helicase n=1 Tax=Prolixibacter bellariivorans TaxID=314319 RepID=A0A5M4AWU7_9BACT|nr:UvrD-helicase domain-containing protein [Prolixibacter bellariivorans]GET32061.1 DNA helicase [Prolixibacter bellariivorans]